MLRISLALLVASPLIAQDAHHGHHAAGTVAVPRAAERELDAVRAAVERYRDVRVAEREGWKRALVGGEDTPLMGEHWVQEGVPEPDAGQSLDFTRPQNLQYALVNGKRELVGVAFIVRIAPGEPVPEGFAGSADHWHVHDVEAAMAAMTETRPLLRSLGNWWLDGNWRRDGGRTRLAMVHAWVTVPSPDGPFSMHNRAIPYLRLGLPLAWAGSAAAANGVNLATPKGCEVAFDGRLWIAERTARASTRLARLPGRGSRRCSTGPSRPTSTGGSRP
jgi:hypothetical protein